VLLIFLVGCGEDTAIPTGIIIPTPTIDPLEKYYRENCNGYRIKDTMNLDIMGLNYVKITDKETVPTLAGLRNGKLWFALFEHAKNIHKRQHHYQ